MAYALWDRFLSHNPSDPNWPNRDRFVLSPGHASALLYSLLHLTGYDLSMDELKQFRQWGSKTPGHPEYGVTPGVEATTGPLGQGFGNAVGMALAERWLATRFNKPGHEVIDHHTYAIVSDGDLQEGIASEAASMAGTLGLGKLVMLYDDNEVSIEGNTDITFRENVGQRFQAYGWHVISNIDGNDVESVSEAIAIAKAETVKPSLLVCRTIIGYGSPNKAGTAAAHAAPLGDDIHTGWYRLRETNLLQHIQCRLMDTLHLHIGQRLVTPAFHARSDGLFRLGKLGGANRVHGGTCTASFAFLNGGLGHRRFLESWGLDSKKPSKAVIVERLMQESQELIPKTLGNACQRSSFSPNSRPNQRAGICAESHAPPSYRYLFRPPCRDDG